MADPYLPRLVRIESIIQEVGGERPIRSLRIPKILDHIPGQCAMIGVLGVGESMISISSSPTEDFNQFSILRMGKVTSVLHELSPGDHITIRGAYGNGFPVRDWEDRNLVIIAGGIGLAPLRSLVKYVLDNRDRYGELCLIYGARSSGELCFKSDLEKWIHQGIPVHLSIDRPEPEWRGFVGFVPQNLVRISPSPRNSIAVVCGPPIMIKITIQNLLKLGFSPEQIYTTLEARMKCGVGKCGRCNLGSIYVCKHGPVFSYAQLTQALVEW